MDINQLQRQLIVHSFIYYLYDESVWSDDRFDNKCKELVSVIGTKEFKESKFYNIFKDFRGETGMHLIRIKGKRKKEYFNHFSSLARRLIARL